MLARQRKRCAICRRHRDVLKEDLHVDHNHATKAVRGLLCNTCNRGIGFLQDDPKVIKRALNYLMRTS